MEAGNLVTYNWPKFLGKLESDKGVGLIVKVESWVDKGAPDRNCGIHVWVQWPSGEYVAHEPDELELVTHNSTEVT